MKKGTIICLWVTIGCITLSQAITTKRLNEQSNVIEQIMEQEIERKEEQIEYLKSDIKYKKLINEVLEMYQKGVRE